MLLHLVLFLWFYWNDGWQKKELSKHSVTPKSEQAAVVMSIQITPPPKRVLEEKKKVVALTKKAQATPKYVRTDDSQPKGKSPDATRIGAHDTLAQSNAKTSDKAPNQAATKGEKRDDESSINSRYNDGDKSIAEAQTKEQHEVKPSTMPNPSVEEKSAAKLDKKEFIEKDNSVANELRGQVVKPNVMSPDVGHAERQKKRLSVEEARRLAEDLERRRSESLAKLEEQQRQEREAKKSTKAGFSPATKASEAMGSISRNGTVSSQNTKATPTGRYTAAVIDSVAKEWYRRCSSHRDLLVPGALTIRWFIDEKGHVKHLNIIDERQGGEIQKGITVQSINSAQIPKMPNDVRSELNGDPLKIQINFEF